MEAAVRDRVLKVREDLRKVRAARGLVVEVARELSSDRMVHATEASRHLWDLERELVWSLYAMGGLVEAE